MDRCGHIHPSVGKGSSRNTLAPSRSVHRFRLSLHSVICRSDSSDDFPPLPGLGPIAIARNAGVRTAASEAAVRLQCRCGVHLTLPASATWSNHVHRRGFPRSTLTIVGPVDDMHVISRVNGVIHKKTCMSYIKRDDRRGSRFQKYSCSNLLHKKPRHPATPYIYERAYFITQHNARGSVCPEYDFIARQYCQRHQHIGWRLCHSPSREQCIF